METIATIKGQIVIPSALRRKLGIKEGTRIQIELDKEGKHIILTPITREYINSLRGKYNGKPLMKALMAEKKREREALMPHKTKAFVLDTWTIIAYLQDEPAAEKITNLIADAHEEQVPLFMSVINVCEVWYILARELSEAEADTSVGELHQLGIHFEPADLALAQEAAKFKVKGKISLGDCFAGALAKQLKADLVTGDTEFKQVEGQVKILWL